MIRRPYGRVLETGVGAHAVENRAAVNCNMGRRTMRFVNWIFFLYVYIYIHIILYYIILCYITLYYIISYYIHICMYVSFICLYIVPWFKPKLWPTPKDLLVRFSEGNHENQTGTSLCSKFEGTYKVVPPQGCLLLAHNPNN